MIAVDGSLMMGWLLVWLLPRLARSVRFQRSVFNVDGILVPGGFGERGIEGKIKAIEYSRKEGIPYFGICLGMQLAVIEYARNVCGMNAANSAEFKPDGKENVIDVMASTQAEAWWRACEAARELGMLAAIPHGDSRIRTHLN